MYCLKMQFNMRGRNKVRVCVNRVESVTERERVCKTFHISLLKHAQYGYKGHGLNFS